MALFSFRKKAGIPTAEEALPGRAEPLAVPDRHFVTRRSIKPPFPEGFEQAVFGMGCFWGAERKFWQTEGVHTTAVGYAGGATPNPTYDEVCSGMTGHAEVVLVVFDPKVVSYDSLLRVFWEAHDPTQGMRQGNDSGTQYRSTIYTYGDAQAAAATPTSPRWRARATARSRPRSGPRHPSTTPRATTSSTSPRIPVGTAGSAALAWRVPQESPPPTSSRSDPRLARTEGKTPANDARRGFFCHLRLALDLPRGAVQCEWWSRS
jgi:peptide-methionine (S)-S-oxide reductase